MLEDGKEAGNKGKDGKKGKRERKRREYKGQRRGEERDEEGRKGRRGKGGRENMRKVIRAAGDSLSLGGCRVREVRAMEAYEPCPWPSQRPSQVLFSLSLAPAP